MMKVESLYVHYPFCRHLCNYCDFHKSIISDKDEANFQKLLRAQIGKNKELIYDLGSSIDSLKTLYIGGGTPSLWGGVGVRFLIEELSKVNITLDQNCEFTLELNPGSWAKGDIEDFLKLGVNRLSIGVQSLNDNILKKLDRVHTVKDVYTTLELVSSLNINYSVDFMLGLPGSEQRMIFDEIDNIMVFKPSHLSSYILTVNKNYVNFNQLPKEDSISQEYLDFVEYLKKYNFSQYEVSNFCRPTKESNHNMQYWLSKSVAALGPSSTGLIIDGEGNTAKRYRWKVGNSSLDYSLEELDERALNFERIYLALRVAKGVDLAAHFPKKSWDTLGKVCKGWKLNGFSESAEIHNLSLSPKGFLLLDSLFSDLFHLIKS